MDGPTSSNASNRVGKLSGVHYSTNAQRLLDVHRMPLDSFDPLSSKETNNSVLYSSSLHIYSYLLNMSIYYCFSVIIGGGAQSVEIL